MTRDAEGLFVCFVVWSSLVKWDNVVYFQSVLRKRPLTALTGELISDEDEVSLSSVDLSLDDTLVP